MTFPKRTALCALHPGAPIRALENARRHRPSATEVEQWREYAAATAEQDWPDWLRVGPIFTPAGRPRRRTRWQILIWQVVHWAELQPAYDREGFMTGWALTPPG